MKFLGKNSNISGDMFYEFAAQISQPMLVDSFMLLFITKEEEGGLLYLLIFIVWNFIRRYVVDVRERIITFFVKYRQITVKGYNCGDLFLQHKHQRRSRISTISLQEFTRYRDTFIAPFLS